jgi:hypothetical protein
MATSDPFMAMRRQVIGMAVTTAVLLPAMLGAAAVYYAVPQSSPQPTIAETINATPTVPITVPVTSRAEPTTQTTSAAAAATSVVKTTTATTQPEPTVRATTAAATLTTRAAPTTAPQPPPETDRTQQVAQAVRLPGVRIRKAVQVGQRLTVQAAALPSQSDAVKSAIRTAVADVQIDLKSTQPELVDLVGDLFKVDGLKVEMVGAKWVTKTDTDTLQVSGRIQSARTWTGAMETLQKNRSLLAEARQVPPERVGFSVTDLKIVD